jgi:hypothetical protein
VDILGLAAPEWCLSYAPLVISEKLFRYFSVFGRGEKNGQLKNDFCLTKNA